MGETENKLRELAIELPEAPAGVGAYVPWVRIGNLLLTSGQLPFRAGKIAYEGQVGADLSVADGYEAARLCAINALAQFKAALGELDHIRRIARLEGMVHSAPGFQGQPQVLNGASELLNVVLGERGRHTRVAQAVSNPNFLPGF